MANNELCLNEFKTVHKCLQEEKGENRPEFSIMSTHVEEIEVLDKVIHLTVTSVVILPM